MEEVTGVDSEISDRNLREEHRNALFDAKHVFSKYWENLILSTLSKLDKELMKYVLHVEVKEFMESQEFTKNIFKFINLWDSKNFPRKFLNL